MSISMIGLVLELEHSTIGTLKSIIMCMSLVMSNSTAIRKYYC